MVERDLPKRIGMDQRENPRPQPAPIAPTSAGVIDLLLQRASPRPAAAANPQHLQARSSQESDSCATRGMLRGTRLVPRAGICHGHRSAAPRRAAGTTPW